MYLIRYQNLHRNFDENPNWKGNVSQQAKWSWKFCNEVRHALVEESKDYTAPLITKRKIK